VAASLAFFLVEIFWRRTPWDVRYAFRRRSGPRPASVASEP
jgi:hypothetical protein